MENKRRIRIFINDGKNNLLKKLETSTPLSKLRDILKDKIPEEFNFCDIHGKKCLSLNKRMKKSLFWKI